MFALKPLESLLRGVRFASKFRETFHPPSYCLSQEAIRPGMLEPAVERSFCEWKGIASCLDAVITIVGLLVLPKSILIPRLIFAHWLAGWRSIQSCMGACRVDGERVTPQPGGFNGGWITSRVRGPFKGDPGHPELI